MTCRLHTEVHGSIERAQSRLIRQRLRGLTGWYASTSTRIGAVRSRKHWKKLRHIEEDRLSRELEKLVHEEERELAEEGHHGGH